MSLKNIFNRLFGKKNDTKFPGVLVAEVLNINPHPNADRLRLVAVDNGREKLTIVCGACNMRVGDKVPLASMGAILPNGADIKEATIRGVKSCGMLCAADELGLGTDHSGIMILDDSAKVGENIDKYIK